jgi:hypothetical protein
MKRRRHRLSLKKKSGQKYSLLRQGLQASPYLHTYTVIFIIYNGWFSLDERVLDDLKNIRIVE